MDKSWIQETFLKLVQIDSHSLEEGQMAKACRSLLEEFGFTVTEDNAGRALSGQTGNLIGILKGKPNLPKVLLAAHMDTVQPGRGVSPRIDENEVIWSDGTTVLGSDDKAGVTAALAAVREIVTQNLPHGDIEVLFTIAEEIGLKGAKELSAESIHAQFGLSLDSGGPLGSIVVAGPSQAHFTVEVTGKSAHAGVAPEKGISAIKVAAGGVSRMPHGRIDEETTVNIGSFVGQGPTNIVADKVTLIGEARSRNPEKLDNVLAQIEAAFAEVCKDAGATFVYKAENMYDGFNFEEGAKVRGRIENALRSCGFTPNPMKVGGGSDANVIQSLGLPIMNIGIGYEDIHTTNEHIALQNIVDAARVAVAFCTMAE
jgi:tripeptide aminopeptidase